MIKLAHRIYDVVDELTSGDVQKVIKLAEDMPESVKQSYIPSLEDMGEMNEEDAAVTLYHRKYGSLRKYALNSKELTMLNLKFLEDKAPRLPDEIVKTASTNLKDAADFYKVDFPESLKPYVQDAIDSNVIVLDEIDKLAFQKKLDDLEEQEKQAFYDSLTDADYALPKDKKYPIHDQKHIKIARDYFLDFGAEFDVENRLQFARSLVKKAAVLNMKLPDVFEKYAYLDINSFSEDFLDHIAIRMNNVADDAAKAVYDKLFKKHANLAPIKVAELLGQLDEYTYLTQHYGNKIEDPIIATFGMNKEAEWEVDGRYFTQSDLNKLASKDISAWLDTHTADSLQGPDGPEIFISLPLPIREALYEEMEV
jgi:hypothetical protein